MNPCSQNCQMNFGSKRIPSGLVGNKVPNQLFQPVPGRTALSPLRSAKAAAEQQR
ncbi:MAG: hypothetical protein Marn2KO_23120 [Marinobacter nauticus]